MELPKNDRDFAHGQPIGLHFGTSLRDKALPDARPTKSGRLGKAIWLAAALGLGSLVYLAGGLIAVVVLACSAIALLVAAAAWGIWITDNVQH